MRFQNLGLMAVFMFGVQGQETPISNKDFEAYFNQTAIQGASTGSPINYPFTIRQAEGPVQLWLIQTIVESGNQQKATKVNVYCTSEKCPSDTTHFQLDQPLSSNFVIDKEDAPQPQGYFFLCLTYGTQTCGPASPPFNINPIGMSPIPPNLTAAVFPTTKELTDLGILPFHIQSNLTSVTPTTSAPGMITSIGSTTATVLLPPTGTVTPTPSDDLSKTGASKDKAGLATGAKVGIAVGGVVVVLVLLLFALFLLRKKHRQRSSQEGLMLNQSLNADSRDLITEKDISPVSYNESSPALGVTAVPPASPNHQTRHSALAPYEPIPAQPYNGSAASIPRRKPTISTPPATAVNGAAIGGENASGAVAATIPISREVSSASSIGPLPRSQPDSNARGAGYEQYHDVPVYSDARHAPHVFQGKASAPFLGEATDSERGGGAVLSEADQERLAEEDEERRIDAAIAEAERAKGTPTRTRL